MKKSYIKIIFFIFTFSFILLLNCFQFKILDQIGLNIVLLISMAILYVALGFEKDRHRYSKDIILEIIIILIAFFLLYYLSGLLIGYAKNSNYFTFNSFKNIIFPIIFYILIKEFLRYQLLMKSSESKILIVFVFLFFIIMDNMIPFSSHTLGFNKDTFLLIAITFLPALSENILCTYLSLHLGYQPGIIYLLIMNLYKYLLPIIPNPNEYLYSLIFLLLPLFVLMKIKDWFKKDRTEEIVMNRYNHNKHEFFVMVPLSILVCALIYVVSGYFQFYAIAIASGSMEPKISKGDVVIVDKNIKTIQEGDILAHKHEGKVIVHRVYRVVKDGDEYFVYTKGDANEDYDKYKITTDMFVGIVKFKIPVIGYPTVLVNERWS